MDLISSSESHEGTNLLLINRPVGTVICLLREAMVVIVIGSR